MDEGARAGIQSQGSLAPELACRSPLGRENEVPASQESHGPCWEDSVKAGPFPPSAGWEVCTSRLPCTPGFQNRAWHIVGALDAFAEGDAGTQLIQIYLFSTRFLSTYCVPGPSLGTGRPQ